MRIKDSVPAKTSSLAYYIWGWGGDIFGLVHDSVTKLPAFIKVIQAKPFNASDIKRNLRVEVHIFIPGKADIESIVF